MSELKHEVEQNIARYAGAVLVNRALCDSRDMLKPSTRTLIYSQIETSKNLPTKPYMKCARIVGDALGHWYTHGDASCYSIYARLAKPFAMRYPLEDFHGNYGTLKSSGNEAASRYTEIKLAPLGYSLFTDIEKETIEDWELNFEETESYPRVSTSRGFYNIVNGSVGIGYGAASQIPQFNLREVNKALIKLLWNPDIDPHEIICLPDFATGAILLNKQEVIESLINGTGKACKLRSVIEYDEKRRTLRVTEIPYGVYTDTIREQIKKLVDENEDIGIEGMNDMSARNADIEIYLSKNANPAKVLKLLYKETSLEYYSGINMTMLENGRIPKVFTWKEALQSYLNHQIDVYTKGFLFDLNKIKSRLPIVEGLIRAVSIIDDVIATIKSSENSKTAASRLQELYGFTEAQTKAILDIKLSKLTHLDISKLEKEQADLIAEQKRIESILSDQSKLKQEIANDLTHTMEKFGDERRTKITNYEEEENSETPPQNYQISLTNKGNLLMCETSSLYTQKRGGTGVKIKLDSNEYIIESINADSSDTLLLFTKDGTYTHCAIAALSLDQKVPADSICNLKDSAQVCAIAAMNPKSNKKSNIIFVTKYGYVKKSLFSEYGITRSIEKYAIDLEDGDEIVQVLFLNEENIGIASAQGNFIIIKTSDIRPIGRVAKGIHGMKLNEDDYVISAATIPESTKEIVSVSGEGLIKRTSLNEFSIQGKNTKGSKVQKLNEGDWLADFLPIAAVSEILIVSTRSCIRLKIGDVPLLSKAVYGNKSIKLNAQDNIISLSEI